MIKYDILYGTRKKMSDTITYGTSSCGWRRVWTTDPHDELQVKMGTEGVSAKPATTVFKVFQKTVEQHGEEPALKLSLIHI